jgi:hypothetical protein
MCKLMPRHAIHELTFTASRVYYLDLALVNYNSLDPAVNRYSTKKRGTNVLQKQIATRNQCTRASSSVQVLSLISHLQVVS